MTIQLFDFLAWLKVIISIYWGIYKIRLEIYFYLEHLEIFFYKFIYELKKFRGKQWLLNYFSKWLRQHCVGYLCLLRWYILFHLWFLYNWLKSTLCQAFSFVRSSSESFVPFAHPSVSYFKCFENVIEKHVSATNDPILKENIVPHQQKISQAIKGLETCDNHAALVFIINVCIDSNQTVFG